MVNGARPLEAGPPDDALVVASRRRRVLAITLVFAAVGPPVGTMIFLMAVNGGPITGYGARDDFALLIMSFYIGYLIGGIPAIAAGLMIASKHVYRGGAGWPFVLGIGLLVGIALEIFFHLISNPNPIVGPMLARGTYCAVAALSTVICWLVIRMWLSARKAHQ
jgi:hypothetical protein